MIRQQILCPCCLVPFTRTIAGDRPLVPCGWYYPPAQADWCQECRLGVRWFLSPDVEALINEPVKHHGTPVDVEAWARKLAENVGNLTD